MKKIRKILIPVLFAVLLALGGCASDQQEPADSSTAGSETQEAAQPDDADAADSGSLDAQNMVGVTLVMPEGVTASDESAAVDASDAATVYDALMATGWDVQAEDSEYGMYVTSINGVKNGSQGESSGWVFTVNGEQVMEGCDSCELKAGDVVEWSFYM